LRRERTAAFACHFAFGYGARFVPFFFGLWHLFYCHPAVSGTQIVRHGLQKHRIRAAFTRGMCGRSAVLAAPKPKNDPTLRALHLRVLNVLSGWRF
jgi:hypothetical protein